MTPLISFFYINIKINKNKKKNKQKIVYREQHDPHGVELPCVENLLPREINMRIGRHTHVHAHHRRKVQYYPQQGVYDMFLAIVHLGCF